LRFRLTLWNTVVVLIASLLAIFAMREAMRLTIENEARALLREEATELELAIKQLHPDQAQIDAEFERKVLGHSHHEWFAALYDDGDNVIWQSKDFDSEFAASLASPGPDDEFVVYRTSDQLVIRRLLKLPDGSRRTVFIGEPTRFMRRDVWQLTKVMLVIGAGLLVMAPAGGYLLAQRATRPVREIIATTRALDPAHLDSRLAIRGTGDELDQISAEINSFVDQISRYINSQREFIANAAHELRSPLTAIQTSSEVCLSKTRTPKEYQDQLETVSEQCQFLRRLVNQLLELAESDAGGKVRKLDFDFSELLQKSLAIFSGVAEEKGIRLITCIPPRIRCVGDPNKLIQVLNNLIDNAIKFTPSGGTIDIELAQRDGQPCFRISDDGPGVPEDQLERIFERFFQVDPSRNSGNGLGLSICKAIIQQHDGTIRASSQAGLTIEFLIPVPGNPQEQAELDISAGTKPAPS
jgi:signal transduction histidine kinase